MAVTWAYRPPDPAAGPTRGVEVIIGFAECLAGVETAWSLAEAGASVTAFARRGAQPPLRRCADVKLFEITPPESDVSASVADLRAAVVNRKPQAVMPLDDVAVWMCDKACAGLPVAVAGATGEQATLALDKRVQVAAAAAAGLDVPATRHCASPEEALEEARFPCVIRPALAAGELAGRIAKGRAFVCADRAEAQAVSGAFERGQPVLVQPYIRGTGEGLFGFVGHEGAGGWSAHRRLRMINPEGSGASACAAISIDPSLQQGAERMLTKAGWRGMFMLEFLRDAAGRAWFMELNGRPWGSMALARRRGLEYPVWALADALGLPPTARTPPAPEPLVCRHLGRDLVHLLSVFKGPRSAALGDWPRRGRTLRDVLAIRRNDRFYNWRRGDFRLFLDDTLQTVLDPIARRTRDLLWKRGP